MPRYETYVRRGRRRRIAIDGLLVLVVEDGPPRVRSSVVTRSAAAARKEYERRRGHWLEDGFRLDGPAVYADDLGPASPRVLPAPRPAPRYLPADPDGLLSAIEVVHRKRLRPTTPERLALAEERLGIRLPGTYRAFVTTLGAGELGGWVRIHAPRPSRRGFDLLALVELFETTALDNLREAEPGHRLWRERLVPFADTCGGDILVWKLPRSGTVEPPVFILPRTGAPRRAAPGFAAVVRGVVTNASPLRRALGIADLDLSPRFLCMG